MDFGTRLAAWLAYLGMTQRDLATAIDQSPAAVNAWIKNKATPKHANLLAIVEHFEVSLAEFYGPVPKPKNAGTAA